MGVFNVVIVKNVIDQFLRNKVSQRKVNTGLTDEDKSALKKIRCLLAGRD